MSNIFKDCAIEGMIAATGSWVRICEWSSSDNVYDAVGWADAYGDRIGTGTARLPDQGWIDFTPFAAIRPLALVP